MMRTFKSQDMQRQPASLQEAAIVEPVVITYHDRPRLVLMSMEEYDRLQGRRRSVGSIEELPESIARELEGFDQSDELEQEPEAGLSRGPNS